ncbi:MAG: hypothetical protein H0Z35_07820 [Thermoanaerobacteraceae bacterium]|nr:hypothetical protein [Thermoanaerobacteraceae bacterium]
MYAILGRNTVRTVARLLKDRGLDDAQVQVVDSGEGPQALEEASRVPADILLLDVKTGPGLGPAVLRYRLKRQKVRVILLAPGSKPGDGEVASIVQAGVYDIVTDLSELEEVLDGEPAGLEAAAKWLDPGLAPDEPKEKERIKVIEKRVAVSQRPVLIAVAGTASGVGTTAVACALAGFLARCKHRTVLVEAGEPSLEIITGLDIGKEPLPWVPNLDVCRNSTPRDLVRARKHSYVVADLGMRSYNELIQMDADLIIVILPQIHRISRAVEWLKEGAKLGNIGEIQYVIPGNEKIGSKTMEMWGAICLKMVEERYADIDGYMFLMPLGEVTKWPPGYGKGDAELDKACSHILADVMPDMPERKRKFSFNVISKLVGKY